MQEFFQPFGSGQHLQDAQAFHIRHCWYAERSFKPFFEPDTFCRIDDVHELYADTPAIHTFTKITDFAQDELGDVVFVELPEVGDVFDADEEIGSIESVKAVAEFYTPVGGEVVACNAGIEESPELVNSDPHAEGWLVRIRMSEPGQVAGLMTAEQYLALTGTGAD